MSECQTKAGNLNTFSLTHSLTHSLSHSYFLIHSLSTCWTTFVFMSMLKSHSLTFTLSHSHTLALSHALILSFTLSRHTELLFSCVCSKVKSLKLYRWKWQCFITTTSSNYFQKVLKIREKFKLRKWMLKNKFQCP